MNLADGHIVGNNYIADTAVQRTTKFNQNYLVAVCGQTGSGKSWDCLSIAETICERQGKVFDISHVVFTVQQLLDLLNNNNLVAGDVIIFDEVGVAANARKWQSVINMALNYLVQTFRYLNLTVLFSCPSFDYIDIAVRKLFHGYLETQKIDRKRNMSIVKFNIIQFNPKFGKLYNKYPMVRINGITGQLRRMAITMPGVKIRHAYDIVQKEYKNKLKEEIQASIGALTKSDKKKAEENKNTLTVEQIAEEMVKRNISPDQTSIELEFGVGRTYSKRALTFFNKNFAHTRSSV